MSKKYRPYLSNVPKRATVTTYPEYWDFIKWVATPSPLKIPQTETELSKTLSVNIVTLSRWRHVEGFGDDVRKEIKYWAKNKIPNVIQSLYNKIIKDGNAGEVKLFLEWVDEWAEKSKVEHEGKIETTPDTEGVRALVEKFEKELKESYRAKK